QPKRPSRHCWALSRHVRTRDSCLVETRFSSPCLRGRWSTELPSWQQPNVSRLTPGLRFSSSPPSSLTNHCRLIRRPSRSEARTRNREILCQSETLFQVRSRTLCPKTNCLNDRPQVSRFW